MISRAGGSAEEGVGGSHHSAVDLRLGADTARIEHDGEFDFGGKATFKTRQRFKDQGESVNVPTHYSEKKMIGTRIKLLNSEQSRAAAATATASTSRVGAEPTKRTSTGSQSAQIPCFVHRTAGDVHSVGRWDLPTECSQKVTGAVSFPRAKSAAPPRSARCNPLSQPSFAGVRRR